MLISDLEEASQWYVSLLGAVITHKQPNYYRLKLKNTNIALLDSTFKSSKPHIAILCDKLSDLPDEGERIQHRDGTTGVYITDPSGNYIEFIHYNEKYKNILK
jgi:catechol-2,3-dioxygenase